MKTSLLLFLFILVSSRYVWASNSPELEPLFAFTRDHEHLQVLYESLIEKDNACWMIVIPSLGPEHAVILKNRASSQISGQIQLSIETSTFLKNTISSSTLKDGELLTQHDRSEIQRNSKDISETDSILLTTTTLAVLQRMKMPKSSSHGNDGITYLFCLGHYSGKIWNPITGAPASLVKVWTALEEYVSAATPEKEQESLFRFRSACAAIPKDNSP